VMLAAGLIKSYKIHYSPTLFIHNSVICFVDLIKNCRTVT
jgi:hypothetical protein